MRGGKGGEGGFNLYKCYTVIINTHIYLSNAFATIFATCSASSLLAFSPALNLVLVEACRRKAVAADLRERLVRLNIGIVYGATSVS